MHMFILKHWWRSQSECLIRAKRNLMLEILSIGSDPGLRIVKLFAAIFSNLRKFNSVFMLTYSIFAYKLILFAQYKAVYIMQPSKQDFKRQSCWLITQIWSLCQAHLIVWNDLKESNESAVPLLLILYEPFRLPKSHAIKVDHLLICRYNTTYVISVTRSWSKKYPKRWPKSSLNSFYLKIDFTIHLGNICKKICLLELKKSPNMVTLPTLYLLDEEC